MQLEGKRIIVTGCASGIGAGTIRAFAREGAIVCGLDCDADGGKAAVRKANTEGDGSVHFYHCDIAQQERVFDVFREAEAARTQAPRRTSLPKTFPTCGR